jgi:hypothetical protein
MIPRNSPPAYKTSKVNVFSWDTFIGGLNILLRPNEIATQELAQADNLMLIGRGVPTKRWGIGNYYAAGATGTVRGMSGFYKSDGTNELVSLTDEGILAVKNGVTFAPIAGVSWASGYPAQMAQLGDTMYIVNGQRALAKYSSPTLVGFATIGIPSILGASNISNATGTSTKGYRISAISQVGETLGSTEFTLPNQPQDLGGDFGGAIWLQWTGASAASGIVRGFNIYGRDAGDETFVGSVDPTSNTWVDDGKSPATLFSYPPLADSTGGPVAKYVVRYQDRLIYAGLSGAPAEVLISGKWKNHEKFDLAYGGNFCNIEPDAGDDITGLAVFKERIIVFKQRSIWQITLSFTQAGNFFITEPNLTLITASKGCIAPNSIQFVENDLYYLSQRGVHSLGYQQGFTLDALRTNEMSFKVRPFFEGMTYSQMQGATAVYTDFKYILSFPGANKTIVYDVQRGGWMGPWSYDANCATIYKDSSNNNHYLIGRSDSFNVDEVGPNYSDDKGTLIPTRLATKKEDFGDWSLFKTVKSIFTQMKNVTGTVGVNLQLEERSGNVVTAKSFNIVPTTGVTGWGADFWGNTLWGNTEGKAALTGSDTSDLIRWANINRAARTMQLNVTTSNINDNYELLAIRGEAKPIGSGFRPSAWRT